MSKKIVIAYDSNEVGTVRVCEPRTGITYEIKREVPTVVPDEIYNTLKELEYPQPVLTEDGKRSSKVLPRHRITVLEEDSD